MTLSILPWCDLTTRKTGFATVSGGSSRQGIPRSGTGVVFENVDLFGLNDL